jgi:hypothetical protein
MDLVAHVLGRNGVLITQTPAAAEVLFKSSADHPSA